MPHPTDLADQWRDLADHEHDFGAEAQARTLEWCEAPEQDATEPEATT